MKKALVSVINDLATDQRVHKACIALQKSGFEVLLVGRMKKHSPPLEDRSYPCRRMKLIFEKGPLFYAEFNFRLFWLLLFSRVDLLLSNDLDTLLPNFMVAKLRRKKILFDSHEYFTGTPELAERPLIRAIWKGIERMTLPFLPEMITVNASIAGLFSQEYKIKTHVIRNIPPLFKPSIYRTKKELGLPENHKILIMQGSGINVDRGAEELVLAMEFLHETLLLIVGGGDVVERLKQMVNDKSLENKVKFLPRMAYNEMMQYTQHADIGLSLDKNNNINYRFSLPNKLFDYLHAGIAVLASPLPELKKIIDEYQVGTYINDYDPKNIAAVIESMLSDTTKLSSWKSNALAAATTLCWENEEPKLLAIYERYC